MAHVNDKEVRVLGLSRSGLHAFIGWILAQAEGRHLFLNSAEGKADPFTTARSMGGPGGPNLQSNDPRFTSGDADDIRHRPRDLLVVSHEDSFLSHAFSPWFEEHHDALVGSSRRRLDVVLVRDPFNLFASRLHTGVGEVRPEIAMRIWRQHARADTARPRRPLPRRPLVVSYNRWCGDQAYRREVAEALGIPFTDAGRTRVPKTFGGSSFDGTAYDGRAHQMRVFERWRRRIADPDYRALFDEPIIDLALARFGEGPGGREVHEAAGRLRDRTPQVRTENTAGAPSPAAG